MLIRPLDKLAQEHTQEAVETMVQVMREAEEPRDRLKAANDILDRGYGKPVSATIALPASREAALRMAGMSDAELLEQIRGTELPRLIPRDANTIDEGDDPLLR